MKTHWLLALLLVLVASTAWSQQPASTLKTNLHAPHADPTAPNSPEVWLYTQEMRRYEDPIQAVRRKAEAQASQRMDRIAALKWFGQSNARPVASPVPSMGFYSPSWSGSPSEPYQWSGVAQSPRVIYVVPEYVR